jgi:hypothetical protein
MEQKSTCVAAIITKIVGATSVGSELNVTTPVDVISIFATYSRQRPD